MGTKSFRTFHPRPNTIAAAMFTLRDLGVDCIVLHGPSGCNFKTSRYLEEEGIKCFTTNMGEKEFIFGGRENLIEVLEMINEHYDFKTVAIVGTCASMIIGEDIDGIAAMQNLPFKVIVVNVHCGISNNTEGVILALEAAEKAGLISREELNRQREIMYKATEVELMHGMASMEYIPPSRGDSVIDSVRNLVSTVSEWGECLIVFNPKKELAYIFADILINFNSLLTFNNVTPTIYTNLDDSKGLKKIREDARIIKLGLEKAGMKFKVVGGLDEYAIVGEILAKRIKNYKGPLVVIGFPQSIPPKRSVFSLGVTNGPREVIPLKKIGYKNVIVEIEAHPKVIGKRQIVDSDIGGLIKEYLRINYVS